MVFRIFHSVPKNMRTSNFVKTFVVTSACLLWWHCCFCDSSSSVTKQDVGTQTNKRTSAELHSGPNQELQNKVSKENLKVVNAGNQVKNTIQKDTQNKENVNSVKISKTESEEIKLLEQPDHVETKSKSRGPEKSGVLQSHHENVAESTQKAKPVSAKTKHAAATSPEDAKLPPLKQNLSTSKILTAGKHTADRAQVHSVPQSESLILEESITPPLSSSVPEHYAEHSEPVLPSHQPAAESRTKAEIGDASVVDETEADSVLHHQHPHSEAMPSFDEWKRMMLAEQEKEGLKIPSVPPGKKIASQKRKRNYASYECGAKIVGSNSEAEGTSRILNELVDEYMLNPCKAKIWFVIELCETVQALQIELANFELFSSCPKDFAVYCSDHYPSRDWLLLGTFTAAEQRVLQSFELKQEGFGKFIKVELQSYYGKEHYCPLSVVRIFGTSMVDEYEEMETGGNIQSISEDDEDRLDVEFNVEDVSPGNLFGSAKDAVLSMVKKAAQVLVRDQPTEGDSMNLTTEHQNMSEEDVCKLFPESSESCSRLNGTKGGSSVVDLVPDFLMPYSSFHHVLFRYLRNCESCIVPSEDGNMTSAQPTCRFFQAALGPVLFKGICELFREKPLGDGKPVSDVHLLKKDSTKTSPKHSTSISPPPQIISVIIDGAVESKSLPAYSDSIPSSPVPHPDTSTSALLEELSSFPAPKIEEGPVNEVKVESIQPTKAFQDDTKKEEWGLSSSLTEVSPPNASEEAMESSVIDAIVHPSITDLKITSTPTDHSTPPSVGQSSVSSDSPSVVSADVTPPSDASGFTISEKPLETLLSLQESDNDTVLKMSTVKYEDPASLTEPAASIPEDFSEAFQSQPSGLSDKEDKDSVLMGSVLSTAGGQKESVFMRMSNRIKALELNMSLSSQYLQELSQRYRRQMEEMQRAFNRTIGTLNDTARKAAERDIKQQEVISSLQSQVANLTHSVDLLIAERNILFTKMVETHIFLMIVEAIVMITILSLCARRISSNFANLPCDTSAAEKAVVPYQQSLVRRRNSADFPLLPDVTKKITKRSCSEEALHGGVVIIEPAQIKVEPLPKVKKKTKKKNKGLRRSASNPSLVAKNSKYSPTLKNDECKEELCTAGVLFSASKSGRSLSTKPIERDSSCQSYCDENCNVKNCPKQMPGANCNKGQEKAKRVQSAPLQNLTNGVVSHSFSLSGHSDKTSDSSEVRNCSLKKFLKLQKRDSV